MHVLELLIPPLLPPEHWQYRCAPLHLIYVVLVIKPRASCMPVKHFPDGTISLAPSPGSFEGVLVMSNQCCMQNMGGIGVGGGLDLVGRRCGGEGYCP